MLEPFSPVPRKLPKFPPTAYQRNPDSSFAVIPDTGDRTMFELFSRVPRKRSRFRPRVLHLDHNPSANEFSTFLLVLSLLGALCHMRKARVRIRFLVVSKVTKRGLISKNQRRGFTTYKEEPS
jgi:hypothetical protein